MSFLLEPPETVADRFLTNYGRRSAWSKAMAIAENFENNDDLFDYWEKVANVIKVRLKNEAIS